MLGGAAGGCACHRRWLPLTLVRRHRRPRVHAGNGGAAQAPPADHRAGRGRPRRLALQAVRRAAAGRPEAGDGRHPQGRRQHGAGGCSAMVAEAGGSNELCWRAELCRLPVPVRPAPASIPPFYSSGVGRDPGAAAAAAAAQRAAAAGAPLPRSWLAGRRCRLCAQNLGACPLRSAPPRFLAAAHHAGPGGRQEQRAPAARPRGRLWQHAALRPALWRRQTRGARAGLAGCSLPGQQRLDGIVGVETRARQSPKTLDAWPVPNHPNLLPCIQPCHLAPQVTVPLHDEDGKPCGHMHL